MRYAWSMKLKPGLAEEYKRRHDQIWPEMRAALTEAGFRDYAIFRRDDLLFGTFASDDLQDTLVRLRGSETAARWRDYMADAVENAPDPETGYLPLLELQFYQP